MSNVFITGASSGIGAALARQYAQRGDVLGLVRTGSHADLFDNYPPFSDAPAPANINHNNEGG